MLSDNDSALIIVPPTFCLSFSPGSNSTEAGSIIPEIGRSILESTFLGPLTRGLWLLLHPSLGA